MPSIESRIEELTAEATILEDQLQRKVFEIDKLRMKIQDRDRFNMAQITRLAMKLKQRRR